MILDDYYALFSVTDDFFSFLSLAVVSVAYTTSLSLDRASIGVWTVLGSLVDVQLSALPRRRDRLSALCEYVFSSIPFNPRQSTTIVHTARQSR